MGSDEKKHREGDESGQGRKDSVFEADKEVAHTVAWWLKVA